MTTTKITAKAATLLHDLRELRAAHAAHKQLERELATYTRPDEISDLLAAVDAQESAGAAEVRRILHHNLADYHRANRAS